MNNENESIQYDCFRGCTVTTDISTGALECTSRRGCCNLRDFDYLKGVPQERCKDLF